MQYLQFYQNQAVVYVPSARTEVRCVGTTRCGFNVEGLAVSLSRLGRRPAVGTIIVCESPAAPAYIEITMEHWIVEEVHLEREADDTTIETHTVACASVDFTPTFPPSEGMVEVGSLRVAGCSVMSLPWTPTRFRFHAKRYLEERMFEIGGWEVQGDALILLLSSSAEGTHTNASDSHINSSKSSDERG